MLVRSEPTDLDVLHALLEDCSRWIREQGIDPHHKVYAKKFLEKDLRDGVVWSWRDQQQIVGLIRILDRPPSYFPDDIWASNEGVWYLSQLAVDREARGQSIGRKILEAVETKARDENCRALRGNVVIPNKKLVQYYLDQRFSEVAQRSHFSEERQVMRRWLFLEKQL